MLVAGHEEDRTLRLPWRPSRQRSVRLTGINATPPLALVREQRDMPAWEMVGAVGDEVLQKAAAAKAGPSGLLATFDTTVCEYLAAEQRIGRIAPDVDIPAFGFLIGGAVHNLLVAGPGYPRPAKQRLERMLHAVADRLAP